MSDLDLPELPSDEELGIAGESLEDLADADEGVGGGAPPEEDVEGGKGGPPEPEDDERGREPAPSRPWRGPVTVAVLLLGVWASMPARYLPEPAPLDAPDTVFSSGRGMIHVAGIAERPHPTGSPEHARVRAYLLDRLAELGLEPDVQTATSFVRRGSSLQAATVRNIVARLPGTASTGAVVLTAHYDANRIARGAGDDASGVATILETMRAIRSGPELRNDIVVLLTDGEELELLGARAFVDGHPWMEDVALVLSVEMRGGGGLSIMFETGPENGWIVQAMKEGDPAPFANSLSYEVYRRLPNDTDFTPFREAGVQGLNFAGIGRAHVYHQSYDEPERYQEATLQHHGLHVLGMVRELGDRDLSVVRAPDFVYLTLPVVGLVAFPETWVVPFGAWLLLVAVLALLHLRRVGGRMTGVLAGLGLAVVVAAVSAGVGWGLFRWLRDRHPEFGALQGSAFHEEGWYVAALVLSTVAVTLALAGLARRRFSTAELSLGAMGLPLVLSLAMTFLAPMAAANLQGPTFVGLGAAAVVAGRSRDERPGTTGWLLLLVLALPVLVVLVPVIELVRISMSFAFAAPLGAILAVAAVLLLPLTDAVGEPNRWWLPTLSAVLAVALVGVGLRRAEPSVDRPAPSTLLYALDRESGRASWATREGPGTSWARSRVGPTEMEETLEAYGLPGRYRVAAAPDVEPPAPRIVVVEGVPTSERGPSTDRQVRLAVRSEVGSERVTVRLPEEAEARVRGLNGRSVVDRDTGDAPPLRSVTHWGSPVDEEGIVLDLDVGTAEDTLVLDVVEHHLRPEELVGRHWFVRPPDLAPDINTLSDRAVLRTRFRVVASDSAWLVVPSRAGAEPEGPEPAAAPRDSAGLVEPDSISRGPDSAASGPDSTAPAPDSARMPPDTTGLAAPDSASRSRPLGPAYSMPRSSTSKMSVAFGGTGPDP